MPRYGFDTFVVDTNSVEVIGPDGVRDVEPQVFRVIEYLVEQRGRLITKEELLDNVWGDRFVSESALTTRIKQARRVLDDDGRRQWAIKTVFGRGYRFLPEVTVDAIEGADAVALTSPARFPEELSVDSRRQFRGRDRELEQAIELLDRPPSGTFRLIWVLGEPGIGKSRVAAEVARSAHDRGHRVVFGRNNEDLRVPYQPFIEAIRATVELVGSDVPDRALGTAASELAPLLPELGTVVSDDVAGETVDGVTGPRSTATTDETRRYELFEAVARWLTDIAGGAPLTMIIEDAHWAAESTLQLLGHLHRRQSNADVSLVVTARDTAPDTNQRVSDLVAASQGSDSTTTIRLTGLSEAAAVQLIGARDEISDIMRLTAGNPLLLQAVNPADGSVDVGAAVRRRVARLDDSVQATLALCSVIGVEFELGVAASAAGRDELDLLDDLEQAMAARLIDDIGVDRFRFTHALVRMSLRDELGSARAARLHARIATALESVHPHDPRRHGALAFHTAEAARADANLRPIAIERLRRAALESEEQLSFEEAATHYRRAGELAEIGDGAGNELVAELALQQGIAETRAGLNVTAVNTFDQAMSSARTCGSSDILIESAIRYEDAAWRPGWRGLRALNHIEEAEAALEAVLLGCDDPDAKLELRTRLAIARMRALAMSGDLAQADAAFAAAQGLTRRLGDPNLEAAVLNVYLTQVRLGRVGGNFDPIVERLEELAPRLDDPDVAINSIHTRLVHGTLRGRFEERDRLSAELTVLQEQMHSRFWEFVRKNEEAMDALYAGDLVASERLAEESLACAEALPEEDGTGIYGLRMFTIRREQDRLASMAPLVRHVLSTCDAQSLWAPGLALILIETGSLDEAANAVASIKEASFDLPLDAMWATVMVLLTEVFVGLGDVEACAALRTRMGRLAGWNVVTGPGMMCFGRADRHLGMLAFVEGDLEAAEEHLGAALEADDHGGSVLWRNESRLWLSRVRRAQGHAAEADAMLVAVEREAREAGLERLRRIAATELGPNDA